MNTRLLVPIGTLALVWLLASTPVRGDAVAEQMDVTLLKAAGIGSDGPALLKYFAQRTPSAADQARIAALVRRLGDDRFDARAKASIDLVDWGRATRPFLKSALTDPDLEIATRARNCLRILSNEALLAQEMAATRLLALRKPAGAAGVVLNYLPFADDDQLEEELLVTLVQVGTNEGQSDPAILAALNDALESKRAAAALVAGRSNLADQRKLVRSLLRDRAPRVRFRAAQSLLLAREKDVVPVLIALLADSPRDLAWRAEEQLFRLAGEQSPAISLGAAADADRAKCRQAWETWWREQGNRIDFAQIDLEQRSLGLTLFTAFDGYGGGQGKVWEARADGKPRWEVGGVQGPIDAQVLPGNRVLIAEHNARRITERDFKGKVHWEHAFPQNQFPVSCQRLQNGNTFLASYNQVFEITADHKEAFSYPCRNGIIYCARKMRNGHIVYVTSVGTLVELDEKGKELRTVRLGAVIGWTTVAALPGGRFLVPQAQTGKVLELDGEGRTVATYPAPNVNAAVKLPNGHLLICRHNDRTVAEIDRGGKVLWEQRLEGRPFAAFRR